MQGWNICTGKSILCLLFIGSNEADNFSCYDFKFGSESCPFPCTTKICKRSWEDHFCPDFLWCCSEWRLINCSALPRLGHEPISTKALSLDFFATQAQVAERTHGEVQKTYSYSENNRAKRALSTRSYETKVINWTDWHLIRKEHKFKPEIIF